MHIFWKIPTLNMTNTRSQNYTNMVNMAYKHLKFFDCCTVAFDVVFRSFCAHIDRYIYMGANMVKYTEKVLRYPKTIMFWSNI